MTIYTKSVFVEEKRKRMVHHEVFRGKKTISGIW